MAEDDNITIDLPRADLRSLLVDAWHDSAPAAADRALCLIEDRIKAARAGGAPYVSGPWSHFFKIGGREADRECRFVFDVESRLVVALQIRKNGGWAPSSRDERLDLTDSLVNANPDALENPSDWGLEKVDARPSWALAA